LKSPGASPARIASAADAELNRGQHQRQTNEARERGQVEALLARAPAGVRAALPAGGSPLLLEEVLQLAFNAAPGSLAPP
jgi:hypothetical protein